MKISDRVKRLFTKSEPEKKDESYFDLTKNIVNARDSRWWNWASIPLDKILYIGDEIDSGNDREIAEKVGHAIKTKDVNETNAVLRILLGR